MTFLGLAESFETMNRPDTMEKMFTQILMKIVLHTFRSFKEKYFLEKKNVANFFFIFLTHFLSKNLSSPKNLKWKFCYTIFFSKNRKIVSSYVSEHYEYSGTTN